MTKNTMIKGINRITLIVTLILIMPLCLAATNIHVNPSPIQKNPGQTFIVNISINTNLSVYAIESKLKFNNSILSVLSAVEGGFLKKDGASTFPIITINNSEGFVKIANTRFNIQTGVSGEGSVLVITFNSSSRGNSALSLGNVQLADPNLNEIEAVKTDGNVKIIPGNNNTPPTSPVVGISPDVAKINADLKCNIITPSSDADKDNITYSYNWYKNNVLTGITGNTVDKSLLSVSDLWICNVTPSDLYSSGIPGTAFKVIVASVPEARIIFSNLTKTIQVLGIPGNASIKNVILNNETLIYNLKSKYLGKLSNYRITDTYNNYLDIILYFPAKGGVSVWSLQYNSGIITTPANYLLSTKVKNFDISQTLKLGKTGVASISYSAKKNITTIKIGKIKSSQSGLHLIELRSDNSVLNYAIN